MIPAAFDYVRAGSAEEAVSLIGEHGEDAKFLAGGHSLLPLMKLRLASPSVLVDIGRLKDLSYIREDGDVIAIGALTRHMDVQNSAVLAEHVPLLAHAAGFVGDPQVRHRGTHRRQHRPCRPGQRLAGGHAGARRHVRRPGPERHARDRRHRLLRGLPHVGARRPTRCSPRSASRRCRAPAGASRSSPAGPRTGRPSASPPGGATATPAWRWSTWARSPILATSVVERAGAGRLGRRRRRAGRRRGRAAGRPQRQRRVPHPPRQGPRASRPGVLRRLTHRRADRGRRAPAARSPRRIGGLPSHA